MKNSYEIVIQPYITEKNTKMADEGKYVFIVYKDANKIEVRKAIEEIFSVHVEKINMGKVRSKSKRLRFKIGKTSEKKKAIVTLKKGEKIELV